MPIICSTCFAEIQEHETECFNCGGLPLFRQEAPSAVELAGQQLNDWSTGRLPQGTLLEKRFTIVQYKERSMEGECYIAIDQSSAQRCFLLLWPEESPAWQYHKQICFRSPVQHISDNPCYSVFPPQEGMPLRQALQGLGWNSGRIWESFRQVCALLAPYHSEQQAFGYLHPDLLWVRSDGLLEFSLHVQEQTMDWSVLDWKDEVRSLIRVLFWLFTGQTTGEHWESIPPKMVALLKRMWSDPVSAGELWLRVDDCRRRRGMYSMPMESKEWLMQVHFPNSIALEQQMVQVPSTIQLLTWNCVTASWRLQDGQPLLYSDVFALYESGFVRLDKQLPLLRGGHAMLVEEKEDFDGIPSLYVAYLCTEYRSISRARREIAEAMRASERSLDWLFIARLLLCLEDETEARRCLKQAQKRALHVAERLQVASFLRWEMGSISEAKRYLLSWCSEVNRLDDWLCVLEAWFCLFSVFPRSSLMISEVLKSALLESVQEQLLLMERSLQRFGRIPFLLEWMQTMEQQIRTENDLQQVRAMGLRLKMSTAYLATLQVHPLPVPQEGHLEGTTADNEANAEQAIPTVSAAFDPTPKSRGEDLDEASVQNSVTGRPEATDRQSTIWLWLFVILLLCCVVGWLL